MTRTVLLGDLMLDPSRNGLTKPKRVRGSGTKMVNMGELFATPRILNVDMDRVPLEQKERISLLKPFDLLFARQSLVLEGAGKCSIFLGDTEDVCFESHIIRVRIDPKLADPRYVFYWLLSPKGKHAISSKVEQGAGAAGIRGSDLQKVKIDIPELPEQTRVADILEDIDEKIELNRRMNETLEQMGQALFHHYFIDNPEAEKWEGVKIGELVNIKGGGTPSTKNAAFWDGDIAWTSPRDLTGKNNVYLLDTDKKITESGLAKISSGLLLSGTLLLSSRAPIGYVALAGLPLAINQGYIAFLPDAYLSNHYMYFWLYRNMERIKNAANGSTFMEISKSAFRNITTMKPDEKSLLEFDSKVKGIFEAMRNNQEQIQTLTTLRDTLLPRLINGKLRI